VHAHLFYAARSVTRQGRVVGVVRVAMPHEELVQDLALAGHGVGWLMLGTIVGAAALSYVLALRVVRPVAAMRASVVRIGAGELETRLALPHLPPLAELAHSINQTTERLQGELQALAHERNLRERILASMSEGVLATDLRGRVMVINAAARRQLGLGERPVDGVAVCEWMRRADVLALLEAATDGVVERELPDPAAPETALWARVTPLRDAAEVRIGTLVVLNDISHVRRLERVRQEFVANVSHELRTPITAIIGFAETLLDAKMKTDPATAERFLTIIRRQAGQLQSIITDLLLLSRLEGQRGEVEQSVQPLAGIVENAVENCQMLAQAQQVEVRRAIPAGVRVMAHAGLLEQALGNLIQNAIQYGGSGGRVEVIAEELPDQGGVRVQVRDFGPGIPAEHLDRIFERFYRVDKGRSRSHGGTGLGLSIVKHVAQVHHGNVAVASEPGKGCVFSLWLPPVAAA
jgi:two-component system phosphate regulon sensor histidine kinase PhoR